MIKSEKFQQTIIEDGIEKTTITESTTNIQRNMEPDYIKIYTKMWCEFNCIPIVYRELFLQLVTRMSYANASDLEGSQLVNTCKPWGDQIMKSLNWKKAMFQRGLKSLCECGAIRKVGRGVYQINPSYAGKGEWKYNPRLERGGVEDLVTLFDFKSGTVKTKIVWGEDGRSVDPLSNVYREGLGNPPVGFTIKETNIETPELEGVM